MKLFNQTSKTFEKCFRVFLILGFMANIVVVVLLFLGVLKPPQRAVTRTEPYIPADMDDHQAKLEIPLRVSAVPRVNEDK